MKTVIRKKIAGGKVHSGMLIGVLGARHDDVRLVEILDAQGNVVASFPLTDGIIEADKIRVTTQSSEISQQEINRIADNHTSVHNCCATPFNAAIIRTIAELSSSWGNAKTPQEIMNMCKANLP